MIFYLGEVNAQALALGYVLIEQRERAIIQEMGGTMSNKIIQAQCAASDIETLMDFCDPTAADRHSPVEVASAAYNVMGECLANLATPSPAVKPMGRMAHAMDAAAMNAVQKRGALMALKVAKAANDPNKLGAIPWTTILSIVITILQQVLPLLGG